jgi:hypothetical protein
MLETIASLFAVIGGLYAFWRWLTKKPAKSVAGQSQPHAEPQGREVFSLGEFRPFVLQHCKGFAPLRQSFILPEKQQRGLCHAFGTISV